MSYTCVDVALGNAVFPFQSIQRTFVSGVIASNSDFLLRGNGEFRFHRLDHRLLSRKEA